MGGGESSSTKNQPIEYRVEFDKLALHTKGFLEEREVESVNDES